MPELNVIDATSELKMLRFIQGYTPPFEVIGTYRLIDDGIRPEATVTLRAGKEEMHEADLGVGPVDALANVLKKSLGQLFPSLTEVRLLDFKVRLIEGHIGTSSQIEVNIIFSDGSSLWKVTSVDDNVNLASFQALLNGYEYAIYLWEKNRTQDAGHRTQGKKAAARGKTLASPKSGRGGEGARGRKATASKAKPKTTVKAKTAAKTKAKAPAKTKAGAKKK